MSRAGKVVANTVAATRYVFVGMPMAILGLSHLRRGNSQIGMMWRSLTAIRCPECGAGVMNIEESQGGEALWRCSACPFEMVSAPDKDTAKIDFDAHRIARLQDLATTMEEGQRLALRRGHILHSRTFYGASLVVFAGAIYMIVDGGFMAGLSWLSMSTYFFVKGLQKAYRSWQIDQGRLFVPGSFQLWWRSGKWFV